MSKLCALIGVVFCGVCDAGGGGEKVPSIVKCAVMEALASSRVFWYTDLSVETSNR